MPGTLTVFVNRISSILAKTTVIAFRSRSGIILE
jgi:hypothetical protein